MTEATSISQHDHFIPIATRQLINHLKRLDLSSEQCLVLEHVARILSFEFYQKLQALKQSYQPFNPDNELIDIEQSSAGSATEPEVPVAAIRELLTHANFTELDQQQIEYALEKTSPYGLEIKIDFDAFEHVALFYRGKSRSQFEIRDWKSLWLKKRPVQLISYRRLFLLLRYRDQQSRPGIHLKLFKDVLRPDLEMLFPECKVRIKRLDKLKLLVTGGGGTAGGLFATIGKISAAVSPWTIVIAVVGFAMLIWRQVSKIFIQKTRYMMTLAQNLYFRNMDNNLGAMTYLVDLARQQEIREAVLAYALLCHHQSVKDSAELDDICERWLLEEFDLQMDFDVSDALQKLYRYDLASDYESGVGPTYPTKSLLQLQQRWQGLLSDPDQRPDEAAS